MLDIKPCICGGKASLRDTDNFAEHTKTYSIVCFECGRSLGMLRKIGEISPKKAITGLIKKWNDNMDGLTGEGGTK